MEQFHSPYLAMADNPANFTDSDGRFALMECGAYGASQSELSAMATSNTVGAGGSAGAGLGMGLGIASLYVGLSQAFNGVNMGSTNGQKLGLISFISSTPTSLSTTSNADSQSSSSSVGVPKNASIEDALLHGSSQSNRFYELMNKNGIDICNSDGIVNPSKKNPTENLDGYWNPRDNNIYVRANTENDLIIVLTHEMTNRIYGNEFKKLQSDVMSGKITPDEYATGILEIEHHGMVNQAIVARETGIGGHDSEKLNGSSTEEADLLNEFRNQIKTTVYGSTGDNAFNGYVKQGQQLRNEGIKRGVKPRSEVAPCTPAGSERDKEYDEMRKKLNRCKPKD